MRRGLSSRIIYYKVTAEVLLGSLCAIILIGVTPTGLFAQPASIADSSKKVEYRLETPIAFFHLNWRSIEWLAHGVELPDNPTR